MLDEKGEIVAPNEFIPAQRYGSIAKIDCWVIKTFFSIYHKLYGQEFISKGLYSNPCRSRKFFTPPQPSPNPRSGSKKFTNDLGLLYTLNISGDSIGNNGFISSPVNYL